jgi:peptidoglycan/LPS O-acetylase OafA/YrhL
VEAFFYASFPFILIFIHRHSLSAARIAAIATVLWVITHFWSTGVLNDGRFASEPRFYEDMIYFFPPSHLCSFLFGIAGARLLLEMQGSGYDRTRYLLTALAAGTVVILILNNKDEIGSSLGLQLAYGSSLLSPLFVVFITALALGHSR